MTDIRRLAMVGVVALAAACGGASGDEFTDSVPDARGLSLEVTAASDEGVPAALYEGDEATAQESLSNPPDYLAKTRQAIKDLNAFVAKIVGPIGELVRETAKEKPEIGDAKVYGPKDKGNVTLLLTIKRKAAKKFVWKLEAKALGGPDTTYRIVAVGEFMKVDRAHRGRGVVGLDLDAWASVDTTSKAQGKLLAAFAHAGENKVLVYRLKGFTPNSTNQPPVSGAIYGHRTASGEAVVRFASLADVVAGPNGAELFFGRLHWIPGVGGRADLFLPNRGANGQPPNGDVPSDKYFVARSCWDKAEQEGFKAVLACTVGQGPLGCTVLVNEGSRSACKPGVDNDNEPSESEGKGTGMEPGAPAQPDGDAPEEMPVF